MKTKNCFDFILRNKFTFLRKFLRYYDSASGNNNAKLNQLATIMTNGHTDKGYAGLWRLQNY
jgi:hypothetical protein